MVTFCNLGGDTEKKSPKHERTIFFGTLVIFQTDRTSIIIFTIDLWAR